jgi:hypothetical protein
MDGPSSNCQKRSTLNPLTLGRSFTSPYLGFSPQLQYNNNGSYNDVFFSRNLEPSVFHSQLQDAPPLYHKWQLPTDESINAKPTSEPSVKLYAEPSNKQQQQQQQRQQRAADTAEPFPICPRHRDEGQFSDAAPGERIHGHKQEGLADSRVSAGGHHLARHDI